MAYESELYRKFYDRKKEGPDVNSDGLIHIKIAKVVPAAKWRVIRMLTRVHEFPAHVPSITEASVIEKTRNVIKTRWRIEMDGLPIRWIEQDTLAIRQNSIHFKAIEGDLEQFWGTWKFEDHPQGTHVEVHIHLKVGIPAIGAFADDYVKNIVTKNFNAIIDTLEQRLISIKYASFKAGDTAKAAGFGILGHPYNFNHLIRFLQAYKPGFKAPSREFMNGLFGITPSFKIKDLDIRSRTGEVSSGIFILCTFIPDMVSENAESVYSKVVYACKLAEKAGAGIITLGGFASMVGERLGNKLMEEVDIPITTGNTYTAVLAIDGIEQAVKLFEKDMKDLKVVIVGGTGDIGSACARALSMKARQVTITGRTKSNLRALKSEIKRFGIAKIEVTTDNQKAIKDADVVVAAANTSASILNMDWFKPGSIVCDLAYPKNISYMANRKDIFVFSGGLASTPSPVETQVDIGMPTEDICYGCFCEVLILALEKRYEYFSIGRGNITLEKMDEIRGMSARHGFTLAPFLWSNKVIGADAIAYIKKAAGHV